MCTATGFMVVYGLGGALDTIAAQVGELRARVPVAAPSRDEDAWVWWFTTRRRARRASRHARVRSAGRCDASFHHAPLPSHSQPDGLDHPVRCRHRHRRAAATTSTSQAWGARDYRAVGLGAQRAWLILTLLVNVPVCASWLAAAPLLRAAGQPRDVARRARGYARIMIPGQVRLSRWGLVGVGWGRCDSSSGAARRLDSLTPSQPAFAARHRIVARVESSDGAGSLRRGGHDAEAVRKHAIECVA